MKVLAVCMKYPTLLQTWFVNYLESVSGFADSLNVISLQPGEKIYDDRIDFLSISGTFYVNNRCRFRYFRICMVILKNLFKEELWRFISFSLQSRCPLKDKLKFIKTLELIEIPPPSIVHCHSEKAGYRVLPLLKSLNRPLIMTFHGLTPDGVPDISPSRRKILYENVDKVIVNTRFAKSQFDSITNCNKSVSIIRQGIPLEKFEFCPSSFPQDGNFTAITVGRLDRLKGHQYAIEAINKLVKQGMKITYFIVGSGLYENELTKQVASLGLEESIKFLGSQSGDRLVKIYREAHFFILPSYTEAGSWAETQGIVVQEAQASGVLTLCSRSGGIPECVNDGHDAFLFAPQSSTAIADKIVYLTENPEKWSAWQTNARELVEKEFSLEKMSKKLNECYKELVN